MIIQFLNSLWDENYRVGSRSYIQLPMMIILFYEVSYSMNFAPLYPACPRHNQLLKYNIFLVDYFSKTAVKCFFDYSNLTEW